MCLDMLFALKNEYLSPKLLWPKNPLLKSTQNK